MLRCREPSTRILEEFLVRYARMCGEGQLIERLQAEAEERIVIVLEDRLEGVPRRQRRIFCRQFLHPVKGKIELNLKRLLTAERAIVVEDRYALGWRCELGASQLCRTRDKVEDRGFHGAIVP